MERDINRFTNEKPHIDYLAKDFATFRQLMFDHMSVLVPNWAEANPADLGHVLIEALAYAADYLSYYQDAVATEAYLDSARLRRSVRRHARLLDYFLHEGCNARVWVQVVLKEDSLDLTQGVHLLTDIPGVKPVIDPVHYSELLTQSPLVFTTLHNVQLLTAHNAIPLHASNPRKEAILPAGATRALLKGEYTRALFNVEASFQQDLDKGFLSPDLKKKFEEHKIALSSDLTVVPIRKKIESWWQITDKKTKRVYVARSEGQTLRIERLLTVEKLERGDVLVFDEILDPKTGKERNDPKRRHAVRLTSVSYAKKESEEDGEIPLVKIEWAEADALPFSLYIAPYGKNKNPVTVARGNIVLADQGRRISGEELPPVLPQARYRPPLRLPGLTFRVAYHHENALNTSATDTLYQDPRQAMPDLRLLQQDSVVQLTSDHAALLPAVVELANVATTPQAGVRREWNLRRDLLNSDRFARDYLVEMEENEQAFLRFGFGDMGKLPEPGDEFIADYRIGNGTRGNVGPDTIHHLVLGSDSPEQAAGTLIERIWNPLMAQSGTDPEQIEEARLHAPYAFRLQKEQCITEADYAAMAERYPGVLQAVARIRFIGLWHTALIYIRRDNFELLSNEFRSRLNDFMQHYRQAGYELDFQDPYFVPLQVALKVYLKAGQRALIVEAALNKVIGTQSNGDGSRGFFHPANFAMGKPIYRSKLVAALMQIPGVDHVEVFQFGRMDGPAYVAEIPIGPLEVAELQNDPAQPNRGILTLEVSESYE